MERRMRPSTGLADDSIEPSGKILPSKSLTRSRRSGALQASSWRCLQGVSTKRWRAWQVALATSTTPRISRDEQVTPRCEAFPVWVEDQSGCTRWDEDFAARSRPLPWPVRGRVEWQAVQPGERSDQVCAG